MCVCMVYRNINNVNNINNVYIVYMYTPIGLINHMYFINN